MASAISSATASGSSWSRRRSEAIREGLVPRRPLSPIHSTVLQRPHVEPNVRPTALAAVRHREVVVVRRASVAAEARIPMPPSGGRPRPDLRCAARRGSLGQVGAKPRGDHAVRNGGSSELVDATCDAPASPRVRSAARGSWHRCRPSPPVGASPGPTGPGEFLQLQTGLTTLHYCSMPRTRGYRSSIQIQRLHEPPFPAGYAVVGRFRRELSARSGRRAARRSPPR